MTSSPISNGKLLPSGKFTSMHETTPHRTAVQEMAANWQIPRELPDLRRVGIVALDTETHDEGLRPTAARPGRGAAVMSAASASPGARTARSARSTFPLRHPDTDNFDPAQVYRWLKDLIASGVRIVTQNGLYDWGWLRTDGGIVMPPSDRLEEIGALATLIDENQFSYSLDALCERYGLPGKDETLLTQAVEAAGFRGKATPRNTSGNCRRDMSAPMPRPMR